VNGIASAGADRFTITDLQDYDLAASTYFAEFQPEGPYYVGGWCLFGLLAYEAGRQLMAQGQEVALLTIIDTPNVAYRKSLSGAGRLQMRAQNALFHFTNLVKSSPSEMLRYSAEKIKNEYNLMRLRKRLTVEMALQEVDFRLMDLDPMLFNAATTYQPPPYPVRVLMVQAAETPAGEHWQLDVQWRGFMLEEPSTLGGWRARGDVQISLRGDPGG